MSQTQLKRFSTHARFSIQHIFIGLLHSGPCPGCVPLLRHSCFISTLFSPDFRSPFLDTLRSLCVSGNSDRCFLPGSGGHLAAAGRGGQADLCHRLPFPWPYYNQGVCVLSRSVVSDSLRPYELQPARLLCPWNFPGKGSWGGLHFLLQKPGWTQASIGQTLDVMKTSLAAMLKRNKKQLKLISIQFPLTQNF